MIAIESGSLARHRAFDVLAIKRNGRGQSLYAGSE